MNEETAVLIIRGDFTPHVSIQGSAMSLEAFEDRVRRQRKEREVTQTIVNVTKIAYEEALDALGRADTRVHEAEGALDEYKRAHGLTGC